MAYICNVRGHLSRCNTKVVYKYHWNATTTKTNSSETFYI